MLSAHIALAKAILSRAPSPLSYGCTRTGRPELARGGVPPYGPWCALLGSLMIQATSTGGGGGVGGGGGGRGDDEQHRRCLYSEAGGGRC